MYDGRICMFMQIDQAPGRTNGYFKSTHPIQPDSWLPCKYNMHVIKLKANDYALTWKFFEGKLIGTTYVMINKAISKLGC